ncbi:AIPR family protein [Agromyces sp. Marseille-P2726]|uniref:AIPR family protein n=1 Tax=Agromyces sp. Marseille-P2726 TaxID=2709132 RepID=UPI00156F771B|nr:AIPR family protein [Agromyces sp. Marseille-P2726]
MTDGQQFIRFAAHLVLQRNPFDIDDEALEDGVVDGALDGGVDAVYTLFNGEVLEHDSDIVVGNVPLVAKQGNGRLDVYVVQTKMHGAGTTAIEKLVANLPRLMDLSEPELATGEFNDLVLDRFQVARAAWANLAGYACPLHFHVLIATLTDVGELSGESKRKSEHLAATLESELPGATVEVLLDGARELIARQRAKAPVEYKIPFAKSFPSGDGVVALVRLDEFANFVDDGTGRVTARLLEDNVRDWQGGVEVNGAIRASLESAGSTPFWWLNNGVTLICKSVTTIGESLKVLEPRIVNGLQTTRVIHNFLNENPGSRASSDLVLVRVIMSEDPAQRDSVIRATNSQTNVDPASLRATDEIQRHIEEHFAKNGFFYDRRKGSFRDNQKPELTLLSIRDLGQTLTAILSSRPDIARGKPTSLLKDDQRYATLFNDKVGLEHVSLRSQGLDKSRRRIGDRAGWDKRSRASVPQTACDLRRSVFEARDVGTAGCQIVRARQLGLGALRRRSPRCVASGSPRNRCLHCGHGEQPGEGHKGRSIYNAAR